MERMRIVFRSIWKKFVFVWVFFMCLLNDGFIFFIVFCFWLVLFNIFNCFKWNKLCIEGFRFYIFLYSLNILIYVCVILIIKKCSDISYGDGLAVFSVFVRDLCLVFSINTVVFNCLAGLVFFLIFEGFCMYVVYM